jgi:two-component system sensor histidine kinase HydH
MRPGMRRPAYLAIEAVSEEGPRILSNAFIALTVTLGAAATLLVVALLFWRQSRRAEAGARAMDEERIAMWAEMEKDKRLKALGHMSAVLGHELKNPIAALKGHAQLLLEQLSSDHPARARAATVVSEARLLETLTNQVLEFARTGELRLSKVYVDDLAHGAVALSKVSPVEVTVPDGVTFVLDRARMEEALTNLLVNARQASSSSEPIELAVEVSDDNLRIAVKDRGEGIAEGDEEQIFLPFQTRKARGTGLGLTLVKRIVEAHGGTVSARNRDDGGAVFTLAIPRRSASLKEGWTHG